LPGKWGFTGDKTTKFVFFAKTAWQNDKAFVLPAAHAATLRG
jgi:hypothetical protein